MKIYCKRKISQVLKLDYSSAIICNIVYRYICDRNMNISKDLKFFIKDKVNVGFWEAVGDDSWKVGFIHQKDNTIIPNIKVTQKNRKQ